MLPAGRYIIIVILHFQPIYTVHSLTCDNPHLNITAGVHQNMIGFLQAYNSHYGTRSNMVLTLGKPYLCVQIHVQLLRLQFHHHFHQRLNQHLYHHLHQRLYQQNPQHLIPQIHHRTIRVSVQRSLQRCFRHQLKFTQNTWRRTPLGDNNYRSDQVRRHSSTRS